jgi:lysophospholipid acyltransferase (LPLAT)-like uncharacterized protein
VNDAVQLLLARLAYATVLGLGHTLRWRFEDPAGLLADCAREPVIFAFWHNRIFLLPYLFRYYWGSHKGAALVSASKDGGQLARVLEQFNLVCVRGSSNRRGTQALRELTRLVRQGYDIAITPDGPRGPKYVVHEGVISLAQLTGAPVVPISYVLSRQITINSWDSFGIPLPGARCTLRVGTPLRVPPGAAAREEKRLELERVLQALSAA